MKRNPFDFISCSLKHFRAQQERTVFIYMVYLYGLFISYYFAWYYKCGIKVIIPDIESRLCGKIKDI